MQQIMLTMQTNITQLQAQQINPFQIQFYQMILNPIH